MTREEAGEYAKNMTYRTAIYNALQGRAVPFRKATKIKLNELLEIADKADLEITTNAVLGEIRAKIAAKIGGNGSENDGLDKALAIIDEYIREGQK